MAKRIDRARIESGKFELPKKLGFLISERIDFHAVVDRDGTYSVEVPASVLSKLVKARADLKALKVEQKQAGARAESALDAERAAHEETRKALATAERRSRVLEKKLGAATGDDVQAAPAQKRGRKSATTPDLGATAAIAATTSSTTAVAAAPARKAAGKKAAAKKGGRKSATLSAGANSAPTAEAVTDAPVKKVAAKKRGRKSANLPAGADTAQTVEAVAEVPAKRAAKKVGRKSARNLAAADTTSASQTAAASAAADALVTPDQQGAVPGKRTAKKAAAKKAPAKSANGSSADADQGQQVPSQGMSGEENTETVHASDANTETLVASTAGDQVGDSPDASPAAG